MRIIVNGQQAFGKATLEKILELGTDEVVAVFTAPDKEGRPFDPLKQAALDHGLKLFQFGEYKSPEVLEQIRALDADLMVMAFMIIFVPEMARDTPRMGSICFHPSLLPLHRGPSSINWPIMWGETKTGFSWFYPTDGLDEGDILLQREVTIEPDDSLGDIYFKKIFPQAVESVTDVLEAFRIGNPPRTPQDDSKATYESWCRKADVMLDWSKPVAEVYNMIRAGNPQPGAWTKFGAIEVQIFDSEKILIIASPDTEPGLVTEISEQGIVVQAEGGGIRVKRVRPSGGDKQMASSWVVQAGITVGTKLG